MRFGRRLLDGYEVTTAAQGPVRSAWAFAHDGLLTVCHGTPDLEPRPTAVLAVVDELALCLLDVAAERDIAIPDELSVIGFDNLRFPLAPSCRFRRSIMTCSVRALHAAAMLANQSDTPDALKKTQSALARFISRNSHGRG